MGDDPKDRRVYVLQKPPQRFIKATKWNILTQSSQSPDLNPIEHACHLLKTRLQTESLTNKQQPTAAVVKT